MAPGVGANALALVQRPQPPPIEAILAVLLNELSAMPTDIVLVLDDYHMVDTHDIQDGMAFLLEHLPPRLHLVITTRADPALPLARLRARGELVEIRAADLRFTPDEADAYLNGMMGLDLAARDVAALEGRTEGWIAALQLAALSIQGRDDIAGFIAGFAGDDRYIVDYLVEEVLQRQPERVRGFLLQTSILGRLNGPLCDAVTGHDGGKAMLEALDRGNLFLVSLDDRRQWYRYHQLFARRAACAPAGRAVRPGAGPAPAGVRVVRGERRSAGGHPPRAGRRGLRPSGGPGRAGRASHAPDATGGHRARLAPGAPERGRPATDPCSAFTTPARCCSAASWRASRLDCGTPSGGWTRRRRGQDRRRLGWSWWTRRNSGLCRA